MPASSRKALVGALTADLAIAVTKLAVGTLIGSTSLLAEAVHSVVDAGESGLILFGEARTRKPPDAVHPFGHGMELYFWTVVVAMVVFGGGGGLSIYEGVRALLHPRVLTDAWAGFAVIGAAAVFESISLVIGWREFEKYKRERRFAGSAFALVHASKNPAMFVTVLEDSAALIGLFLAAIGLALHRWLGLPLAEGVASIGIGLVLTAEAVLLGVECRSLVIGESASPRIVRGIRDTVEQLYGAGTIDNLRTLQLGPDAILVVLRMRFPPDKTIGELSRIGRELEAQLRRAYPAIKEVVFAAAR